MTFEDVVTASRTAPPKDLPATVIPAGLRSQAGVAELGRRVLDSIPAV